MIKKILFLIITFTIFLYASENKEDVSNRSDEILKKYFKDKQSISIEESILFSSLKNISFTFFNDHNDVLWVNSIKIEKNVKLVDVEKISDVSFYIVGYKKINNRDYDILLLKLHRDNGIVWEKIYKQDGIEIPTKVSLTLNNDIIIGGYCASDNTSYYSILTNDINILKINPDGNRIWVKTIGLKKINEEFLDFSVTEDNELLILGKRKFFKDILYMAKIDKFGNISWQNTYEVGNFIKTASISKINEGSNIKINADVINIDYKSQNISKKTIELSISTKGEKLKSDEINSLPIDSQVASNINFTSKTLKGIIKTNSVNIRKEPLLNSSIVTSLTKGEVVEIIEKTNSKQKINSMNEYWYHLKIDDAQSGWIYGYFVDIIK